jgi:hypothetical protein
MKTTRKLLSILLACCLVFGLASSVFASTFVDAHGNEIELDDTLEAYADQTLCGADDAARKGETNLGDLWADALRWFAVSGKIDGYFEEDVVTAGNNKIAVEADNVVALWNGGNLRADIPEGKFNAETLANVLPYPNKVAVVYMTGAQLAEQLEAASQGLPYREETAAACASFMQVSGLKYTVDANKAFDKGEVYKDPWCKAASVGRVTITEVNGKAFDEAATYAVITSNANYNGMDSSYVFKEAAAADERCSITTAVVRDVVWMYLQEELKNRVGSDYAEPQGRIEVSIPVTAIFSDVPEGAWYEDYLLKAFDSAIISGFPDGTFRPDSYLTHAQIMVMVAQLHSKQKGDSYDFQASKKDGDAWYQPYEDYCVAEGIVPAETFGAGGPFEGEENSNVTRGQMAFYFASTLTAESYKEKKDAALSDIEGYIFKDEIEKLAKADIVGGFPDGTFRPDELVTRAQATVYIKNTLDAIE